MTYPEFLKKLAKTPRTWKFEGPLKNAILFGSDLPNHMTPCPANVVLYPREAYTASITDKFWNDVMDAADGKWNCDPAIRKDLLKACGLVEGKLDTIQA